MTSQVVTREGEWQARERDLRATAEQLSEMIRAVQVSNTKPERDNPPCCSVDPNPKPEPEAKHAQSAETLSGEHHRREAELRAALEIREDELLRTQRLREDELESRYQLREKEVVSRLTASHELALSQRESEHAIRENELLGLLREAC